MFTSVATQADARRPLYREPGALIQAIRNPRLWKRHAGIILGEIPISWDFDLCHQTRAALRLHTRDSNETHQPARLRPEELIV